MLSQDLKLKSELILFTWFLLQLIQWMFLLYLVKNLENVPEHVALLLVQTLQPKVIGKLSNLGEFSH